ncbi:MAG: amidase [Actinobacteria bacterium]|nr:amidase [Actinomycetota bacterium]
MFGPNPPTVARQRDLLLGGEACAVDLVESCLRRIDEVQPELNCFVTVWADEALERARKIDVSRGGLAGIPVAIKDTSSWKGHLSTSGSVTMHDNVARHSDAVVQSLLDAGAIIVGSTNTPEFAHAGITDNPLWGVTRNPWDTSRTPGGSSGGSAAAVASGCVAIAEGSDMGGSVRIPAAWCGIVGLKPSLGRIPMTALPGLFDLLSHHGPLARTVDDAWEFLLATQGPSLADPFAVHSPLYRVEPPLTGLSATLSIDLGCWAVDPFIAAVVEGAADSLRDWGVSIQRVDPGFTARDNALWLEYWGIFMAGFYGNIADERAEVMDPDVLWLIELGRSFTAVDVKRMDVERTSFWNRATATLREHDVILCPTMSRAPGPADKANNRIRQVIHDDGLVHNEDMTSVWNLASPLPIATVPCGRFASGPDAGLPIGMQVVGRPGREDVVLAVARAIEATHPL